MAFENIDLLDLDRWARDGAPHDWFAQLRADAPVWRHPSPGGGPGFWVVSRYDDVAALGRCPHVMSSDITAGEIVGLCAGDELFDLQQQTKADAPADFEAFGDDGKQLLTMDPPEHTAYRKIVNKGFTPRMISLLEARVRAVVRELLDSVAPHDSFDFATRVSTPLPMRVIGDMIGAPREDHDDLLRWSNESVAGTDTEYRSGPNSQMVAMGSMFQYFEELRRAHELNPAEDLTTVLLDAEVDGHGLSPVRFNLFLFLLAVAGNETTRTAISHAMLALSENTEQWDRLQDDPTLVGTAVEEILRWATPVLYFRRNSLGEMAVGGQVIAPGDVVSLWYVSANRDESRFPAPNTFNIGRDPNPQIAFGGGGPHFCLGASLARLEIRALLEELLDRGLKPCVTGPVERLRSNFLHGIKHLPLRLEQRSQRRAE